MEDQIKKLADFIMAEIPGEPSQSEGAVDTAIRLLRTYAPVVRLAKRASEVAFDDPGDAARWTEVMAPFEAR